MNRIAVEYVKKVESGDLETLASCLGNPHQLDELLQQLKAAREANGLSLADLQERSGMDRSAISKLETGQRANPTVETLVRYAEAVGKRIVVSLTNT